MIQILLYVLVIGIGLFYSLKYGNKAKRDIAEFQKKEGEREKQKAIKKQC